MKHNSNSLKLSFTAQRGINFKLKTFLFVVIAASIFSCSKNPEPYIEHIEGYWEIQEVTMADGSKKEYKFNETIDYIGIIDSLKGFRQKLKPGINDTYFTSGDTEDIQLKIEDNTLYIYYTTPYANWKETVLNANAKQLKIMTEDQNIYLYRRYTSIKLDLEE